MLASYKLTSGLNFSVEPFDIARCFHTGGLEGRKGGCSVLTNAELHLAYKVANAPVAGFPYPHCYVEKVFPDDLYPEMQRHLPDPEAMIPIEEARNVQGYPERFVLEFRPEHLQALPESKRKFWSDFGNWMLSGRFQQLVMRKFAPFVEARFKDVKNIRFYNEALL